MSRPPFSLLPCSASSDLPITLLLISSALRYFQLSLTIFATMASADFQIALAFWISAGKICKLSRRAIELYHPCFFDSLWASRHHARSPPMAGLTARSCSYGRRFAWSFFQLFPFGCALLSGYGWYYHLRRSPFTALVCIHAAHTWSVATHQNALQRDHRLTQKYFSFAEM